MKRITYLVLMAIAALSLLSMTAFGQDISVTIDGEELVFDVQPQIIDERTMVPMRLIFESLGAEVDFNSETSVITATAGDRKIIMQLGERMMTIDGEELMLDVPPQLVDGRSLVPVRAVAEAMLVRTYWDGESRSVILERT